MIVDTLMEKTMLDDKNIQNDNIATAPHYGDESSFTIDDPDELRKLSQKANPSEAIKQSADNNFKELLARKKLLEGEEESRSR